MNRVQRIEKSDTLTVPMQIRIEKDHMCAYLLFFMSREQRIEKSDTLTLSMQILIEKDLFES